MDWNITFFALLLFHGKRCVAQHIALAVDYLIFSIQVPVSSLPRHQVPAKFQNQTSCRTVKATTGKLVANGPTTVLKQPKAPPLSAAPANVIVKRHQPNLQVKIIFIQLEIKSACVKSKKDGLNMTLRGNFFLLGSITCDANAQCW